MRKNRRKLYVVAGVSLGLVLLAGSGAPPSTVEAAAAPQFKWVNGKVSGFTFQVPKFNVVGIKETATTAEFVRFCNPSTGADLDLTSTNVQYDLLKIAFSTGKSVQVGVYDFGPDPASGIRKLCIDRVILQGE